MTRKILIVALVTISLAICGCERQTPPENPAPKTETETETQTSRTETAPTQTSQGTSTTSDAPKTDTAKTDPPKTVSPATQNKVQKLKVKVYYPDDAGINLVGVSRTVEIQNDADKYSAAVNLLTVQPKEKDLTVIFPKHAKINSVTFKDGTAVVDFDKNITKGFVGGSTGEELLIGSVVRTLTEFKEVKQVRFLIDSKEVETLSGHMDLSEPIKKSDL